MSMPKRVILDDVIGELDEPTPDWRHHAPCRGAGPGRFYIERGQTMPAVCLDCRCATPCLVYALETGDRFGVWGGYAERSRRHIAHAVRVRRPDLLPAHPNDRYA